MTQDPGDAGAADIVIHMSDAGASAGSENVIDTNDASSADIVIHTIGGDSVWRAGGGWSPEQRVKVAQAMSPDPSDASRELAGRSPELAYIQAASD